MLEEKLRMIKWIYLKEISGGILLGVFVGILSEEIPAEEI